MWKSSTENKLVYRTMMLNSRYIDILNFDVEQQVSWYIELLYWYIELWCWIASMLTNKIGMFNENCIVDNRKIEKWRESD